MSDLVLPKRLLRAENHRRTGLIAGLAALTMVCWLGLEGYSYSASVDELTAQIPDAVAYGDMAAAIRQCGDLFTALQAAKGEPKEVWQSSNHSLLLLQDRKYAEDARYRDNKVPSFVFPEQEGKAPLASQVAFYTAVYARNNPVVVDGRVQLNPSGYYLVCWRTGKVSTVPADQVRFKLAKATGKWTPVFPGMPSYDPQGYSLAVASNLVLRGDAPGITKVGS